MATPNRAAILARIHKILKKHYSVSLPPADRSVLEHFLFASCLENASHEKAEEVFARLQELFFDWNEVRVTTVTELSEAMEGLPKVGDHALSIKRVLQGVFETQYSFDLEPLRKQNLGKAADLVAKYGQVTIDGKKTGGTSPFIVAYVTQHALGGHAIPVDKGTLDVLQVLGVIDEAEAAKHVVPGMERAIPKNKGTEFAALLHQLGADFFASPNSTKLKAILAEIDPDYKSRMPKKAPPKVEEVAPPAPPAKAAGKETAKDVGKQEAGKHEAAKKDKSKEKETTGGKSSKEKEAPRGKVAEIAKPADKSKKKPVEPAKASGSPRKPAADAKGSASHGRGDSKKITKRKPR